MTVRDLLIAAAVLLIALGVVVGWLVWWRPGPR
jgi:hypothetical protein